MKNEDEKYYQTLTVISDKLAPFFRKWGWIVASVVVVVICALVALSP